MDQSFINDCLVKDVAATEYWKAFEQAHPECQEVIKEARRYVSAIYAWGESTEIEEQWDKLQDMMSENAGLRPAGSVKAITAVLTKEAQPPRWFRRPVWKMGAAAAFVGILVTTGLYIINRQKQPPISYLSLSAPAGIVRKCTLPDGSTVWLDAGSAIRYKEDPLGNRGVDLIEGQIFCKVKHDAQHPFSVHTPAGLDVKDIGTAFSVHSYKGLNSEVVRVLEGEVAVKRADSTLQLLKERQGMGLDVRNGTWSNIDNSVGEDTSWISGRIELNDVTFGELAIVLEKTYDIHISFQQSDLMKSRASTSFNRKDPVKDVLDALRLIYGISYTLQGRSLVLYGPGHH